MLPSNPSQALAQVIIDELARCGLTDAVLAPGSRSTALAYALHDDPRVRLHVELDERSAAFLAVGLARGSGRPAAVVTTSGTATANLFPAVVEADAAGVPVLLLTADRPPELRHTGANQTVDQIKLYGDRVRWFCEVGVPEERAGVNAYWRSTACRAWAAATGRGAGAGPAGPVHLNLAFREPTVPAADDGRTSVAPWSTDVAGRADGQPWVHVAAGPRRLEADELGRWARTLVDTPRGLILVGAGDVLQGGVHPGAVRDLAEATGYPVVAEVLAGQRPPGTIAHGHLVASDAEVVAAHRPDLVVRFGRTGLSRAIERWLGPEVDQVLVDAAGAWSDPARSVHAVLAADPSWFCHDMAARIAWLRSNGQAPAAVGDDEWRTWWATAQDVAAEVVADHLDVPDVSLSGPSASRAVLAAVPDGGTLVVASSAPVRDLDAFGGARDGVRVVANRGASGIDGFVSTALGVALATDGPTVALAGDLSFLHDQAGLLLHPDADHVDLVLVVVDNDGGGLFHQLPQARFPGFERLFATPHGLDLLDVAHTHNLAASVVTSVAQLRDAVPTAVAAGGVHLLVVPTDRESDVAVRADVTKAVAAVLPR